MTAQEIDQILLTALVHDAENDEYLLLITDYEGRILREQLLPVTEEPEASFAPDTMKAVVVVQSIGIPGWSKLYNWQTGEEHNFLCPTRVSVHNWSPDSRYVYYSCPRSAGVDIFGDFIMNVQTGQSRSLMGRPYLWSPTAAHIVVVLDGMRRLNELRIGIVDIGSDALTTLSTTLDADDVWATNALNVKWSSNGTHLAHSYGETLTVFDLQTAQEIILVEAAVPTFAWSALDTKLAYAYEDRLNVIDIDSGEETIVSNVRVSDLRWSPDGQWLAYLDNQDNGIHSLHLETGNRYVLRQMQAEDMMPHVFAWSLDSTFLIYNEFVIKPDGTQAFAHMMDLSGFRWGSYGRWWTSLYYEWAITGHVDHQLIVGEMTPSGEMIVHYQSDRNITEFAWSTRQPIIAFTLDEYLETGTVRETSGQGMIWQYGWDEARIWLDTRYKVIDFAFFDEN